MISEEIDFIADRFHLFGTLVKPETPGPWPAVIFVHWSGPTNRGCHGWYLPIWERFVEQGYACMSWDKPGSGESRGEYDKVHLFQERASVVEGAIRFLKRRRDIDPGSIGLWGMSQAGWVMPLVAAGSEDVSFIIAVSCAGESGVRQGAYLTRSRLLLQGLSQEEAERFGELYLKRNRAETYEEYLKYAKPISEQQYLREVLKWGELKSREDFTPNPADYCQFMDPVPYLERVSCPVLALWGEKDTSVDVNQAVEAYRGALTKAGNTDFQFVVFPETSHLMTRTKTGDMKEWSVEKETVPEFLDTMERWLIELRK